LRPILFGVGALAAVLAVALTLHLRAPPAPPTTPPPTEHRSLAVYNALTGDLSLVEDATGAPRRKTLGCARLGKWAVRAGVADGQLIVLDTEHRAIEAVPLAAVAAGCASGGAELPVRRVPLHASKLPCKGRLVGERLYVTYFADNLIESYRWPALTFEDELHIVAERNLGLSDLDAEGTTLLVAGSGYACFDRHCPDGRYQPARVFFLDATRPLAAANPPAEVRPANVNTAGVIARPPFAINVGDVEGGYGSLQRIAVAERTLGPEIKLPRAASPSLARALPGALVVAQMSGEHVFLVDTARDQLRAILRFDGQAFVAVPVDVPSLAERSAADFQDILVDPRAPDRLLLVDAKGERLVRARWSASDFSLTVESVTALATEAYKSTPDWAVWLPN
jgi:hypothetical protein